MIAHRVKCCAYPKDGQCWAIKRSSALDFREEFTKRERLDGLMPGWEYRYGCSSYSRCIPRLRGRTDCYYGNCWTPCLELANKGGCRGPVQDSFSRKYVPVGTGQV